MAEFCGSPRVKPAWQDTPVLRSLLSERLVAWLHRPTVASAVAKRRHSSIVGFGRTIAQWFLDSSNNFSGSIPHNGEEALLGRLAPASPDVVFDVGANFGEWTTAVRSQIPNAVVHAFEVAPPAADVFRRIHGRDPLVHLHEYALGDRDGEWSFNYDPLKPGGTSVLREPAFLVDSPRGATFDVKVRRGDDVAAQYQIEHIDVLKLDVEGSEPLVLEGFSGMLQAGAIDVIQFEYGYLNALSGFLMHDYFSFFHDLGFVVGRVFPTAISFEPYRQEFNDFRGTPNWIAVRRTRDDLILLAQGSQASP